MTTLKIKPVDGVTVRDPQTLQPLAVSGEEKPRTSYWLKRLKDGDVIEITETTKKGAK